MARRSTMDWSAVYVLQRLDRVRFKVGWALEPQERASRLPEYWSGELDLPQSKAIWLPGRERAREVERSLHRMLAPYHAPAPHLGDGHSEWFGAEGLSLAMGLLGRVPVLGRLRARVVPLDSARRQATPAPSDPQDVWWRLEDLFSRLAAALPVAVRKDGDVFELVLHGFRRAFAGTVGELRIAAADLDTYAWAADRNRGSFIRFLAYEGDALVVTLVPAKDIARWPGGEDLVWQVRGFLARLKQFEAAR